MTAINMLGYAPLETNAEVETHLSTPQSCFIDGVQFSSGCTLGKMNIQLREDATQSIATFHRGGRRVKIKVKEGVLERVRRTPSQEMEKLAITLAEETEDQLFNIETI